MRKASVEILMISLAGVGLSAEKIGKYRSSLLYF
jgi:hypothetical protein